MHCQQQRVTRPTPSRLTITQVVHSSLETTGIPSAPPFPTTSLVFPTTKLNITSLSTYSSLPTILPPTSESSGQVNKINILTVPIATYPPPGQIAPRSDYPRPPVGVRARSGPLQTNKFYENLLLDDQRQSIWPQPYSLTWAKGGDADRGGLANSWGLSVSNIDRQGLLYGDPIQSGEPPKFFTAPLYVESIILSASELDTNTVLTTDSHDQFSLDINLTPKPDGQPVIRFPVVQGMGFVSALYTNATPLLQSSVFFTDLIEIGDVDSGKTHKWRIQLKDGTSWLLYITPDGSFGRPSMVLKDSNTIIGPGSFTGLIQVAKNTAGSCGERVYDGSAGTYATSLAVSASVDGATGNYSFIWRRAGSSDQQLLMFALPHHIDTMSPDTLNQSTCVTLWTTTKGEARGLQADMWLLQEQNLPTDIDFDPWKPGSGAVKKAVDEATAQIDDAAATELALDIDKLTNLDSAYYGGKALSKFALIIYAVNKFGKSSSLALEGLRKLEAAFDRWISNKQVWPFAYDSLWGGIVSTASYEDRDIGADFGNTLYNDHHFHYGYFVHTAAVIAALDPDWLKRGSNKVWVDTLIRDYANPDAGDPYFPPSRSFDFFNGHSWATGLFPSGDGKNEESSSEDAFSIYAMKLWGKVTGDSAMEARGNLQLAILRRSLNHYFYFDANNTAQPPRFTPQITSGILFENKIDHTTFFGQNSEYVEGIHMLPISPVTPYMRPDSFVSREWSAYFQSPYPLSSVPDAETTVLLPAVGYAGGYNCSSRINLRRLINCVDPAWKGILMANLAQLDPKQSWQFFADKLGAGWDWMWVAGSGSRTWYLAYAAALGGTR
ncbi:uncharacterized protein PV09_08252 [Verruconis gallopava]|uniref:glucan endo-1,3-beta-D-glucosidase n=1 Tax=Verruconis gallopava TaxID=253628 RepID=A0A0D1YHA2_9PEZI|nr:uncharacterized protein PV09_08252 [Verruconis gallopava]KIW00212.1 hypothetical protein PV09_08252 [Verruconis gallopava]